ncbi:MAG: hypothetical protein K2Y37_19940 [Pirellulales bacterium]|nr:hypothetical protein [Pirellulales bacterium]
MMRWSVMAFGVALFCAAAARAQVHSAATGPTESTGRTPEPHADGWRLERVVLADGTSYAGLIERVDAEHVFLRQVLRQPGRPMHLIGRRFARGDVARIERLPQAAHQELTRRVDEHVRRLGIEAGAMKHIELRSLDAGAPGGWQYRGPWFHLESRADEETTRRAIVRIEQAFGGFRRLLPPRLEPGRPLVIVLCGSTAEYRERLDEAGLRIVNPAVYLADKNTILAATDIDRYAEQVRQIRAAHDEQRRGLDALRQKLADQLERERRELAARGVEPSEIRKFLARTRRQFEVEIAAHEQRLAEFDRRNLALFDKLMQRTLARLFHEAFHAYLSGWVYPPAEYNVPGWFNEGLAQVFESGLFEAGTLRIDAPPADWLARLQTDLGQREHLPLAEVLAANAREYLVAHDAPRDASARLYLYAWGLAWYLSFDEPVLGTPALERYLARGDQPTSEVERFETLVGMPLEKFETRWRAHLQTLAPQATSGEANGRRSTDRD